MLLHRFEIVAGLVVFLLLVSFVAWLAIGRYRAKRKEQPRLRLADLRLPVDDWRIMVPPEWRTEDTERLIRG